MEKQEIINRVLKESKDFGLTEYSEMPLSTIDARWKDRTKRGMKTRLPKDFNAMKFDGYRMDLIKIDAYITHLDDIDNLIKFLEYCKPAFKSLGKASPRDLTAIKRYLNEQ